MVMAITTVTAKGQVTVPKAIREALGLRQGDRLAWEVHNGEARVKVVTPLDLNHLQGLEANLQDWMNAADDEAFAEL